MGYLFWDQFYSETPSLHFPFSPTGSAYEKYERVNQA